MMAPVTPIITALTNFHPSFFKIKCLILSLAKYACKWYWILKLWIIWYKLYHLLLRLTSCDVKNHLYICNRSHFHSPVSRSTVTITHTVHHHVSKNSLNLSRRFSNSLCSAGGTCCCTNGGMAGCWIFSCWFGWAIWFGWWLRSSFITPICWTRKWSCCCRWWCCCCCCCWSPNNCRNFNYCLCEL